MILKKGFKLDKFEQKALKTIKKYRMLKKNDKVLVAVSGGPDSVALLNVLLILKTQYNLSIHVFHLDHMIRKEKSRKDAIFVKKLTDRLKLPRTILSFNVPVFSKELGYSLEEAGRKVRYKLYEKVSAQIKADKIALGHQADDQIETFLMRMIRGTGLEGLSGIPPRRGKKIIRPLIETSRDEIESYCFQKDIKFRTDETNLEGGNLRSKIRYYLLPYLLAYNRQFRKNILNLINIVREEDKNLNEVSVKKFKRIAKIENGRVKISRESLKKLPKAIRRRVLRKAILLIKGSVEEIEFKHIDFCEKWLMNGSGNFCQHLPGDIEVYNEYGFLIFSRRTKEKMAGVIELNIPGDTKIEELGIVVRAKTRDKKKRESFNNPLIAYLDLDIVKLPLKVRIRKPGDRFIPLGMEREKKLQDFLVDLKIPKRLRDDIPIFISKEDIVWVGGYRVDDRYKIKEGTKKLLILKVEKADEREN